MPFVVSEVSLWVMNKDVPPTFGKRLRQAREFKELTQGNLGFLLGCSKQIISHWETGRNEPNLGQIAALCEILGITSDWLIRGKRPEPLSDQQREALKQLLDSPAAPDAVVAQAYKLPPK
jgi:transcriptional regulator with XRE-family HTH domain